MKQIKLEILLLLLCILALGSCKKSNTTPKASVQSIAMKFNGTAYSGSAPFASYSKSQNALQVAAKLGAGTSVYLAIPSNLKVGTFDITKSEAASTFASGTALSDTYIGTSGSIVITSFTSTTVAGTFQFKGTNLSSVTGDITEGKFQANYTTQ
jgi:hypothetical protein